MQHEKSECAAVSCFSFTDISNVFITGSPKFDQEKGLSVNCFDVVNLSFPSPSLIHSFCYKLHWLHVCKCDCLDVINVNETFQSLCSYFG